MPKTTTTKSTSKKPTTKKTTARAKSAPAKKATVKKKAAVTKKAVAKKTTTKKAVTTKKTVTKKAAAKKTTTTRTTKTTNQPVKKKTVTDKQATATKTVKKKTAVNAAAGPLGFTPYQEKKGEEYMGADQVAHFRNILQLWKQQLMEEVDSTVGHMQEDDNVYADPVDRASMEADFNLELRTRDRERKLIRKIESAMDDLDRGEYGYCEDCGADIGIRRLEARPTATKCIDCKTFQEIKEKQGA